MDNSICLLDHQSLCNQGEFQTQLPVRSFKSKAAMRVWDAYLKVTLILRQLALKIGIGGSLLEQRILLCILQLFRNQILA